MESDLAPSNAHIRVNLVKETEVFTSDRHFESSLH